MVQSEIRPVQDRALINVGARGISRRWWAFMLPAGLAGSGNLG